MGAAVGKKKKKWKKALKKAKTVVRLKKATKRLRGRSDNMGAGASVDRPPPDDASDDPPTDSESVVDTSSGPSDDDTSPAGVTLAQLALETLVEALDTFQSCKV